MDFIQAKKNTAKLMLQNSNDDISNPTTMA
nr:MAG TPA_asm: hypothetical protein [Caudoviricetes sp.]